jgi:hypothetical protein
VGDANSGPVTLEILDAAGKLVRRYSSADPVPPIDPMLAVPLYWARPPRGLSAEPGLHRWLWDMHYTPLPSSRTELPIAAVPHNTVPEPAAPWVMPGRYTVKLTAGGQTYTEPLTVKMDPRVRTPLPGLMQQFTLAKQCYDGQVAASKIEQEARSMRQKLQQARERAGSGPAADAIAAFDKQIVEIAGSGGGGRRFGRGAPRGADTIATVSAELGLLMRNIENADLAPTAPTVAAVAGRRGAMARLTSRWNALKSSDLPKLNTQLRQANLPEIAE